MERNFTPDNFEHFLRQNADGLRMRPSEDVWEGIAQKMQKRKRRWGFLLIALLAGTAGGYYFLQPADEGTRKEPAGTGQATASAEGTEQHSSKALATAETKPETAGARIIPISTRLNTAASLALHTASTGFTGTTETTTGSPSGSEAGANEAPVSPLFEGTVIDEIPGGEHRIPSSHNNLFPARDPMTIESVVNLFRRQQKSKVGYQLYLTPTVSYRKLTDNKDYVGGMQPLVFSDINSAVTHKPDIGLELGFAAKYPLGPKVKLRAGVQFNVTRYEIKTYHSSTQMATIRLNNRNGADSMNAITNYNNYSGYKSNWLENLYFQVSAPVGVELMLKGDEKMQFGVAGTVQPTYVLRDRVYLISTDYKNYAEVPALVRRWNMNTSIETFVAYSTGKLKWQVGPQVRYQVLSSYKKKYPVKEHLFDFGLKMGVSLNKR